MRRFLSKFFAGLFALAVLCAPGVRAADSPPNLIIIIPDGFGPQGSVAARLVNGAPLTIDSMILGLEATRSTNSPVADSAATATAIATGVNTSNGRIGEDENGKPLATIMEAAQAHGYATGLVATSRITHATPACFAAHVMERGSEARIAEQLVKSKFDLMLGGGEKFFHAGGHQMPTLDHPDTDKDLVELAKELGFNVLKTKAQLNNADPKEDGRFLGLFDADHVAYAIDRREGDDNVGLMDMTVFALDYMAARKASGFCIMIEASRIDHAAHGNDAACYIQEILDFDRVVKYCRDFAKADGNTQIIITADHDCGGFSVGGYGIYDFNIEVASQIHGSSGVMGAAVAPDRSNVVEALAPFIDFELTPAEIETIRKAPEGRYEPGNTIGKVLSERMFAGWTSGGHTGADVTRYGYGPVSEKFSGLLHHTETGRLMQEYLGVRETVDKLTAEMQANAPASTDDHEPAGGSNM